MIAHDVLTYLCARSVGFPSRTVPRTAYSYGGDDPGPYNPGYQWEMREGSDPAVRSQDPYFDETDYYAPFVRYHHPVNGGVDSLEVLSLYSAEPDWGMDAGLRLSPLQVLTGGSQGYRHLRYGLFFFKVGKAPERVLHFTDLAALAATRRDSYWCLRFAARALHYLQDLTSPFHTKPFRERDVPAGVLRPRRLYFAVYNYHLNLERMVGYRLWHGDRKLIDCIVRARAENRTPEPARVSVQEMRKKCREARTLVSPLFARCLMLFPERMLEDWVKISPEEADAFFADDELQELSCAWLSQAASLVKWYIRDTVIPLLTRSSGGAVSE